MKAKKMHEEKWPKYRFIVLLMNMITFMLVIAFLVSFSISAPYLKEVFNLTDVQLNYGYIAYTTGLVISLWWGGKVFDKYGMKKTMLLAALLFLIPQFLIPTVFSWPIILLLRFIQGNVAAMFLGLVCLNGLWFPEREHGLASGIFMGGLGLGTAVGNIFCSALLPIVGWQKTFFILGIIAIFIIFGWFLIASKPIPKVKRSQSISTNELKKSKKETEEKSIYKIAITWLLAIIMLGNCWQIYAMYGVTQTMLFDYGYSLSAVGILGLVLGLIGVLSTPLGGICSDKLSRRMITPKARVLAMFIGFLIAFIGTLLAPFLSRISFGVALFAMVLMGWGVPWTNGPYWALPVEVFPKGKAGEGAGVAGAIGNTADIFGPLIATFIGVTIGWTSSMAFLAVGPLFAAIACLILISKIKRET
jgi:MFS family permease